MGDYVRLAIKCPRCGAMNQLRAERPAPESQRASSTGDAIHEHERDRSGATRLSLPQQRPGNAARST
ncbi:Com family DNA-binding transcriptional regulator [Cupriavidus metallidurans]|nr:Com family DNA-binding transcriptional regulator [Cupriavidus metallidurans]